VEKGELLKKKDTKSHFFKTFDNSKGAVRLNFTLENTPPDKTQELAVINFRAKTTGKSGIRPISFEVLDANMKKTAGTFPPFTIEVEK